MQRSRIPNKEARFDFKTLARKDSMILLSRKQGWIVKTKGRCAPTAPLAETSPPRRVDVL